MSDKPTRLEGLNAPSSEKRKPARRFTPNVVDRRSKQERESTAPSAKPAAAASGTGSMRGHSGQKPFQKAASRGIRTEAQGAFSAPAHQPSRPRFTPRSIPRGDNRVGEIKSEAGSAAGSPSAGGVGSIPADSPVRSVYIMDADSMGPLFPQVVPQVAEQEVEGVIVPEIKESVHLETGEKYLVQIPETLVKSDSEVSSMQVGTLRRYASGRVTLICNGTELDLQCGSASGCVEELFALNDEALHMGHVKKRLVAVPRAPLEDLDKLAIDKFD